MVFNQLLPEATIYNMPLALKLIGQLNIEILGKALNALIVRHESLRTIFPIKEGEAHQRILPNFTINLSESLIDLSTKGKTQAGKTKSSKKLNKKNR